MKYVPGSCFSPFSLLIQATMLAGQQRCLLPAAAAAMVTHAGKSMMSKMFVQARKEYFINTKGQIKWMEIDTCDVNKMS